MSQCGPSTAPPCRLQDVDHLVLKVLEVQDIRQKMHQLQEELNWEKQNFESLQGDLLLLFFLFLSLLFLVLCAKVAFEPHSCYLPAHFDNFLFFFFH